MRSFTIILVEPKVNGLLEQVPVLWLVATSTTFCAKSTPSLGTSPPFASGHALGAAKPPVLQLCAAGGDHLGAAHVGGAASLGR